MVGNGSTKKSHKQNNSVKKGHGPKIKQKSVPAIEAWPIFHLCAIFCFSLAFGLLMMHISILWQHYMEGDSPPYPQWPNARTAIEVEFRDRIIAKYGVDNYYALYFDGHLKVNTSIFVR